MFRTVLLCPSWLHHSQGPVEKRKWHTGRRINRMVTSNLAIKYFKYRSVWLQNIFLQWGESNIKMVVRPLWHSKGSYIKSLHDRYLEVYELSQYVGHCSLISYRQLWVSLTHLVPFYWKILSIWLTLICFAKCAGTE